METTQEGKCKHSGAAASLRLAENIAATNAEPPVKVEAANVCADIQAVEPQANNK